MSSGLYVHVPFCATRCGYCDFNAYAGLDHLRTPYVGGLLAEADLWALAWSDLEVDTVFLGGGTPTRLDPTDLTVLFDGLRQRFRITDDAEITVEANPESLDPAKVEALVAAGVNRVSMGAQSFDTGVLEFLERGHDPASIGRAVDLLRAGGIRRINLDLIYGSPGESQESWHASLDAALAFEPEHISAYALTVEQQTPLGRAVARKDKPDTDPDEQADRYELACTVLADAGFGHYEISNWATPDEECRHNLAYWSRVPTLGLGCGAHSYRDDRRWWNVRPPEEYLQHVEAGRVPVGGEDVLDDDAIELEEVYLALRTSAGLPASRVRRDPSDLIADGFLVAEGDLLRPTDRGMFVANELAIQLTGAASDTAA